MTVRTHPGLSRRAFLGSVAGSMALSALGRSPALGSERVQQAAPPPSDQIVLGMIGVGVQGMSRLREFLAHPDTRIAAICDVDSAHAEQAAALVEKTRGQKPNVFGDFRRVLEDQEIDAVVIVTPDHWHAIADRPRVRGRQGRVRREASELQRRRGAQMADASLKYQRVSQMGNHIHNDQTNYRRVVELVQSGNLGRITRAHCWKTSPTESLPASSSAPRAAAHARLRLLAGAGAETALPSAAIASHVPAVLGLLGRYVHRLLVPHRRRRRVGPRI